MLGNGEIYLGTEEELCEISSSHGSEYEDIAFWDISL
jgi:hypothetical protein